MKQQLYTTQFTSNGKIFFGLLGGALRTTVLLTKVNLVPENIISLSVWMDQAVQREVESDLVKRVTLSLMVDHVPYIHI